MLDDIGNCNHKKTSFIQSSRFSGNDGNGRDIVEICLLCGKVFVSGDRDFKHFRVEFRLALSEQLEAAERWVAYINGEDTRTEKIEEAIRRITEWRDKAYPLDVFPEPDLARAADLLEAGGMTLDAVSASSMRHALRRVCEILGEKGLLHE